MSSGLCSGPQPTSQNIPFIGTNQALNLSPIRSTPLLPPPLLPCSAISSHVELSAGSGSGDCVDCELVAASDDDELTLSLTLHRYRIGDPRCAIGVVEGRIQRLGDILSPRRGSRYSGASGDSWLHQCRSALSP